MTFKRKLVAAYGTAIVVLVSLSFYSYHRLQKRNVDQEWVNHTHQVLEQLDAVLVDLVNAETGERGYVIAGEESYLEPYEGAIRRIHADLERVRQLTSDNARQQRSLNELEPLFAGKLSELRNRIDIRKREGLAAAAAAIQTGNGQELTNQVRRAIGAMQQEEQRLLAERSSEAAASLHQARWIGGIGNLLFFLALILAGVLTSREMAKRRRAEEKLRGSEEQYRLLFDNNPHPAWVYDLKTLAFLDVNQSAVQSYGYSREEFLRLTIKDIRPAEDVHALVGNLTESPSNTEHQGVWRHRKKDGTLIDVEVTSHPITYAGKEGRLVVATDITKRKKAQEGLRQSEERHRLMVQEVKDYAILMLDPEGRVVSWNAGAERIKGYRAEEIIGQHFSRFYLSEDLKAGKPACELKLAAEQGRIEDEGWRVKKDGSRFWANVVITALRGETGILRGFAKVTRDMTERKRSEETRMRLVAILEAAPDFIGFANAKDEHILYVNRAGRKMAGLGEDEDVTKLKIPDVHPEWAKQMLRDKILPAASQNGFWTGECAFLHRDGHEIPVLMALNAHKTANGEVEVFSTISRDITERKRAEDALEKHRGELARSNADLAAANRELEAFSYSVSHDLRAPLRGIDGFSLALLEDCADKLDPQGKDHLNRIRAGTQRMATLIDDLLNLSRIARAEMRHEPVDLSALAGTVAAELRRAAPDRRADFVIAEGLHAEGDSQLIRVALENLLGNAWKFTARRERARIEVGRTQNNGSSAYFVRDNGAGFDGKYVDRLFGAFQRLHSTTEFSGTGIGLATVQRIIHRHGGKVWAEGGVDQGATFFFTL
jgi:PAS domain S-box-containing protein